MPLMMNVLPENFHYGITSVGGYRFFTGYPATDTRMLLLLLQHCGVVHLRGSKVTASDTHDLHFVLFCAALTAPATVDPIQSLTSSVHCLFGLPCFLVPATCPCSKKALRLSALTMSEILQLPPLYVFQQLCGCVHSSKIDKLVL